MAHDAREVIRHHGVYDHIRHSAQELSCDTFRLHRVLLCRTGFGPDGGGNRLYLRPALSQGTIACGRQEDFALVALSVLLFFVMLLFIALRV